MAQVKETMQKCRYCGKEIKKETVICEYCGYNSQSGTLSPDFKQDDVKKKSKSAPFILPKVILSSIFLIASLILLYNSIWGRATYLKFIISNARQALQNLKIAPKSKTDYSPKQLKTKAISSRKSFLNKIQEERKKNQLTIEGIAYASGGQTFVSINGTILSEGDSFKGIKVLKIHDNSVELMFPNGEIKTLSISQSIPLPR